MTNIKNKLKEKIIILIIQTNAQIIFWNYSLLFMFIQLDN